MCFSAAMLFQLAIIIVIIIAAIALLRLLIPALGITLSPPYDQVIRILVGAVIAICIIVFIWRLAECSGLMRLG